MSITEAYVGGIYNEIGLVIKLVVFGLVGLAVVCINVVRRKSIVFDQAGQFARERPGLLAWMVVAVVLGACGTYVAYEAYRTCGENRGITVTITYAAPPGRRAADLAARAQGEADAAGDIRHPAHLRGHRGH